MNINKFFKLWLLSLSIFAFVPVTASAAFTLTARTGDGIGFKSSSYPAYSMSYGSYLNPLPYTLAGTAACDYVYAASGVTATANTYCVFDGGNIYPGVCVGGPIAPGGQGTGGGQSGVTCSGSVASPASVKIYTSGVTQISVTTLVNTIANYLDLHKNDSPSPWYNPQKNDWNTSIDLFGYEDVCALAHKTVLQALNMPIDRTAHASSVCDVYKWTSQPVPTATLTANPVSIASGSSAALSYTCTNSTSASINQGVGNLSPVASGTRSVSPTATTTYTLTCTGAGGSATASRAVTVTAATNTAPNAPTITGSTTGIINTNYNFAFRASDPNGDMVRYGVDWDNNNSVDAWVPSSGYVASNTSQNGTRSWNSIGAKIFKAQTQDSKGATSGWSSPFTITLSDPAAANLNFTINGSTGPLSVALGSNLNLVWSATNVTSCTGYGNNWASGASIGTSGNVNISATASDSYIVNCTGASGNVSRSITVNLANTLKVCQNSCNSGVQRGNTSSTQSFTLAQGGVQNLVSCFNPSSSCNDSTGNVTSSTTWGEQSGNSTVALSGSNPKTVTGNNSGSENISASYNSQTNNMTVNVACLPTVSCDNAPGRENYCQSDTFTVDNGCGVTLNCNGTKSCNYNWKEVAP